MADATDELSLTRAPPTQPAQQTAETRWESPLVIVTVSLAVTAIFGAVLYLMLTDAGGLAAQAAVPVLVGVAGVGFCGLVYALYLARSLRQDHTVAAAFENAAMPQAILDERFSPVALNAAFKTTFPVWQEGVLDAIAARAARSAGTKNALAGLKTAIRGGNQAEVEVFLGGEDWRKIVIAPASPGSNQALLRVEDCSATRAAERRLRADIGRQLDFVEDAPVGVYAVDSGGYFRFVNRRLAGWLGADKDNLTAGGARLHDFVADKLSAGTAPCDPFSEDVDAAIATLVGRDGRQFRALISQGGSSPAGAADGARWAVVSDLSDTSASNASFKGSAHDLEYVFANAPIGVALLDSVGDIVECNAAFSEISGVSPEDSQGRTLATLFATPERADLFDRIAKVAAGEDTVSPFEARPEAHPDTATSVYISRLAGPSGETSGLLVQALDTTEQRKLELQFAQSQKMQAVGQLAGGIAHDFNNLLTAMIGFCDLLLLRHRPGEESFADVMQIKQNANRAANLVRQLLAFSRQQTLESKVLNLTDVLAELTHLLRRLIGENIELMVVHGRDLGLVRVDQGQLEQVIINLVVNARDAMFTGGTLTIQTSNVSRDDPVRRGHELMPAGDYTLMEVIDTGEGISQENLGRIFEPFYSTKEVGSGTGLGLSTVYGIVKQTGGYVFVDSTPGEGATFSVFLPGHDPEEGHTEARKAPDTEDRRDLTGAGTVLLVEDEDAVRLFGARALRNKGYQVLEAASGEEAMRLMEADSDAIDLLITDVVMPNMDGPSLIRKVREIRPDLRVICISGYAEDAFRKRVDRGADIQFLPKPFSLQQLAGKVKDVLDPPGTA